MQKHSGHKNASLHDEFHVEVYDDMAAIRDEWKALQVNAACGPHDTWEWNDHWLSTAGRTQKPLIVTGRNRDGEIVFLLPLTISRSMGCNIVEWLGSEQGNYASGLFRCTAWRGERMPRGHDLLHPILDVIPSADAIHLRDMPGKVCGLDNPFSSLTCVKAASEGHVFPLDENWEEHYRQQMSSRQRSRIRSSERQLNEAGAVEFEDVRDTAKRIAVLEHMIQEKRTWFAEKGIPDMFACGKRREFFKQLSQLPAEGSGPYLKIFTLRVDGNIVATNIGMTFQEQFYGLIASTTPGELKRHAPGRLLFLWLVEHLAKEGVTLIDCGAGEDPDKLRWCTQSREILHAIAPMTLKGRVYCEALKCALKTKRHIKHDPRLWSWAQRLRLYAHRLVPKAGRQAEASRPARLQA